MAEKPYPRTEYVAKRESTVLQCNRLRDKVIEVPRDLPGNIILVHGVNDVGTSYSGVEEGLCAGLQERLLRYFKPAEYKMPGEADKDKVGDDPDAVYFKRHVKSDTDSPVIPFYWGYREVQNETKTVHGQKPTVTAHVSTRTSQKAEARLAMRPAACRICGTAASTLPSTQ